MCLGAEAAHRLKTERDEALTLLAEIVQGRERSDTRDAARALIERCAPVRSVQPAAGVIEVIERTPSG